MNHKVLGRQSVTMAPRLFAEELNTIICLETNKVFSMRTILLFDNEKGCCTNPQNEYSYCPYCGAKLD